MARFLQSLAAASKPSRFRRGGLSAAAIAVLVAKPSVAQSLPLPIAARLASRHAPTVDPGTLLAFAWHESRLHPFAIHDNATGESVFPASADEAATLARARLAMRHSLDLGIMQVNSVNLARTGLTVTTAFDAGESMRAGALILTMAYRQCLRGNANPTDEAQQAALRCAASVYNTGREQAGILNGYQGEVWRAAAVIVPAIQVSSAGALPSPPIPHTTQAAVVAPGPRRPPPGLEDALHATPPVPDAADGFSDALHNASRKEAP
jgi:type IV secretion system protein VirB1